LQLLPISIEAEHYDVLSFIEKNLLMGKGMGYIDLELLTSSVLTGVSIWTLDKRLAQVADTFHIKY